MSNDTTYLKNGGQKMNRDALVFLCIWLLLAGAISLSVYIQMNTTYKEIVNNEVLIKNPG